jgi:hypothetical protein
MITGEQLWQHIQFHTAANGQTGVNWALLGSPSQLVLDRAAADLPTLLAADPDPSSPHVPSQLPPIQPLPKDHSWDQYYPAKPLIDEQRVKDLYAGGYSKERLLRMFVNLSINELERMVKQP